MDVGFAEVPNMGSLSCERLIKRLDIQNCVFAEFLLALLACEPQSPQPHSPGTNCSLMCYAGNGQVAPVLSDSNQAALEALWIFACLLLIAITFGPR